MLIVSMSSRGVDLAVDVHDVGVVEGADDLADRVGLADVGEELVAQALALGGALDDAGDVDERHGRRARSAALPKSSASCSSRGSGSGDDADVGLDRRERVVRREHVVLGQRVEEGGLADVGQSDDADSESHGDEEFSRSAAGPTTSGRRRGLRSPARAAATGPRAGRPSPTPRRPPRAARRPGCGSVRPIRSHPGAGRARTCTVELEGGRPAGQAEVEGHRRQRVGRQQQHQRVGLAAVGQPEPAADLPQPGRPPSRPAGRGRVEPQVQPVQHRGVAQEARGRLAPPAGSAPAAAGPAVRRWCAPRARRCPGRRTSRARGPAPRRRRRRRAGSATPARWRPCVRCASTSVRRVAGPGVEADR